MQPNDEILARLNAEYEEHARIFASLEGAASLIKLNGHVPSFHDAEVTDLNLSIRGQSTIRIADYVPEPFGPGKVIVTFQINELLDINLQGFSSRNIIHGLRLKIASSSARENHYGYKVDAETLELQLEDILGISGILIGRGISLKWTKDRTRRRNTLG